MRILQVDGFRERTGDWTLASMLRAAGHYVEERECLQNWGTFNEVSLTDAQRATGIATYSWGQASLVAVTSGQDSAMTPVELLVVVLGVPDLLRGQSHSGSWFKPSWAKRVVCFQAQNAWPTSEWFKDEGHVWIAFEDPTLISKALDATTPVVNINCDKLLAGCSGLHIHTHLMNHPEVQKVITELFSAIES